MSIQEFDDDFAVVLEGEVEQVSSAAAGLLDIVPPEFVGTADGFLHINAQAATYLDAWLVATKTTHRFSKIVWLPIVTDT